MKQDLPLADELAAMSARMSGLLLSEQTVNSALSLITSLVKETIPDTVGAGVTLLDENGKRVTTAATDPVVAQADSAQYELGEGPCLSAWAKRILVRIDDVSREDRWPRWTETVRPWRLGAMVSAPLVAGDAALGAIKVYGDRPGAYGERAERLLRMFAGQAAVLVANVQSLENAQRFSAGLTEAVRGRDRISIAKGIVMARDGVDEETAFAILIGESQREHKGLRDVADALVRSTLRIRR